MKRIFKNAFLYVAAGLFLLSNIMFIVSYSTLHSSTYEYYQEQYNECAQGYSECMSSYYSASSYYKTLYKQLADSYEDLMDDWEDYMDEIEAKATVFTILGVFFLMLSGGAAALCIITVKKKIAAEGSEAELSASTEETVSEQEVEKPKTFICPKCSNVINYGDEKCVVCGQTFDWSNL